MTPSSAAAPGTATAPRSAAARRALATSLARHGALIAAIAALIFALPYAAGYGSFRMTLWQWLRIQWAQPTWQHGALVPAIAAFLVWRNRQLLPDLRPRPCNAGLALAVAGLLAYWIGYRGNFYFIGYASLQILAAAIPLWLWGWATLRRHRFAWGILLFAWPCTFLEDTLAFQLRYGVVGLSARLLNLAGVATLQDGTALVSAATPDRAQGAWFSLAVDGPCSGMRSLFALMLVAALYAQFRQRSPWRRALLFALSIPLAMLANTARILLLTAASILLGQDFAVGRGNEHASNFHLLTGFIVFAVAVSGLRLLEAALNRFAGRETPLPFLPR